MSRSRIIKVVALITLAVVGLIALCSPANSIVPVTSTEPGHTHGGEVPDLSTGLLLKSDRQPVSVVSGSDGAHEGAALARVRVFVHRGGGIPVARAKVILSNGWSAETGSDGWAVVTVTPGRYLVDVDRVALPKGLATTTLQGMPPPHYEVPEGYYGHVVNATAGQDVETRLRVFASATITGMVVDSAGAPLGGIHVRAQCRSIGLSGYSVDATTRVDGLYVLDGLLPNVYTIEAHSERGALPVRFEVQEGVAYTLDPLVVGGIGVVSGRVIDQDGTPCARVPVVAYVFEMSVPPGEIGFNLANTVQRVETSETGLFRLGSLPAGCLRVQVHPEGALIPDGEEARLASPPAPVTVDLRQKARVELGDVKVVRSRPFRLRLRVELDESAIRRINPTLPSTIRERVFIVRESELRDESKWEKLSIHDGRYLFRCETPSPPLRVIVRISGVPDRELRLDPKPFGVAEASVSYP
jgi:hypothetical protein